MIYWGSKHLLINYRSKNILLFEFSYATTRLALAKEIPQALSLVSAAQFLLFWTNDVRY